MFRKAMCQNCSHLKLIKIKVPSDLTYCIEFMKKLENDDGFEKVASNFELEQPKTQDGFWQNDVMYYSIRCKECGQIYSCVCDTYHGNGEFSKGR